MKQQPTWTSSVIMHSLNEDSTNVMKYDVTGTDPVRKSGKLSCIIRCWWVRRYCLVDNDLPEVGLHKIRCIYVALVILHVCINDTLDIYL